MFTLKSILVLGLLCNIAKLSVSSSQITSTVEDIVDTCYAFLESHLCEGEKWGKKFHFYRPSIEKYSADQWLWDSGSHMIVWSNRNLTNSILDLRTMLSMQQPDGRIPEEIFWSDRSAAENAAILLEYSNDQFADITQMPVLPFSLKAIISKAQESDRENLIREFVYPLINYFKWWRDTRDLGDGLVVVIHNWETGLDASPAYDPAFHVYVTAVNATSRNALYPKFIELVESYNFLYRWDTEKILGRAKSPRRPKRIDNWFVMKDLAVNSIYAAGWDILGDLAASINDTNMAAYCHQQFELTANAIVTKMWIPEQGHFNSLYVDNDGVEKASQANTIQNLFPILLKTLSTDKVKMIVSQLSDPSKFASRFAVPTVALDDPQFCATFDADLMWRGPVWGFTNWFLLEGLELHQQFDLQHEIFNKWLSLVQLSGIWEHYNPLTGAPYGVEGLGMSTLVCDYVYKFGLI